MNIFYSIKMKIINAKFIVIQINFQRLGKDLIIYRDGEGESKFPECYAIGGEDDKGDFIEKNFNIDIMDIYVVDIKSFSEY